MAKIVDLPIGAVPTDNALTVIHQTGDTKQLSIANLRTAMLTPATNERIGAVIVGDGLAVTTSGVLSVPTATSEVFGKVKIGTTLTSSAGTLNYNLPTASSTVLGGIKVGYGLEVNEDDELDITLTDFIGNVTGNLTGSVYSTDNELMIDAVGGVITARIQYEGVEIKSTEPGKLLITGETTFDSPVVFKSYTTEERDDLIGQTGMVIFNTTDIKLQVWIGNAWVNLH
jgi:hypothetical protein